MPIVGSFQATKPPPSSTRSGTFATGGAAARKAPKIVRTATRAKLPSLRGKDVDAETGTPPANAPSSLDAELDSLEDIIMKLETPSLEKSERGVLESLGDEAAPSRQELTAPQMHDEPELEPNGASNIATKPVPMFPPSPEADVPTTSAFLRLEHTVIIAHDQLVGRPHDNPGTLDDGPQSVPNLGASPSGSHVLATSTEQVVAQPVASQWKIATPPMVLALIAIGLAVGSLMLRQGPSERAAVASSARGTDSPPSSSAALASSAPTVHVPPTPAPAATSTASDDLRAIAPTPDASRTTSAPTSVTRKDSKPPRSTRHLRRDRNDGKSTRPSAGNDVDDETQKALDALEKAQLERSLL